MSLDVHQSQVEQSLKMNTEFWPPRGPPSGNNFQMMDDYHQRSQQQAISGFHNNNNNSGENNNGVVDLKDHLMGQENSFNQSQSGFPINQQQPAPVASPGADSSSPESKFNADKFVNEIQVRILKKIHDLVNFWRQKKS